MNSGDIQPKDFKVAIRERGELLLMIDAPTGENVWVVATDGSEPPRLLLSLAYSPVVIR